MSVQDILITDEFKSFWDLVSDKSVDFLFLTGAAGTGKSTALRHLLKELSKTRLRYVVLSPTALAAINIGGQTIHNFFRLPIGIVHKSNLRIRREFLDFYSKIDIIIIDEISMVRADVFDAIDFIMQAAKKNHKSFGGVKMVATGDLYQLSPVINQQEMAVFNTLYASGYFFHSNVFKDLIAYNSIKIITLTKVFRQSDENFINILHRIRDGSYKNEDLEKINLTIKNKQHDNTIMLCGTNVAKQKRNSEKISAIKSDEYIFNAKMSKDFEKYNENSLPSPVKLVLKIGSSVIFTKNNISTGYYNGTIGTVEEIINYGSEKQKIVVKVNGNLIVVEPEEWNKYEYEYDKEKDEMIKKNTGKFEQFPLDLGYAVTIHKSQGQTFNNILINIGYGAFCHGQIYVALSRCKTIDGISLLQRINHKDIIIDSSVTDFLSKVSSENNVLDEF